MKKWYCYLAFWFDPYINISILSLTSCLLWFWEIPVKSLEFNLNTFLLSLIGNFYSLFLVKFPIWKKILPFSTNLYFLSKILMTIWIPESCSIWHSPTVKHTPFMAPWKPRPDSYFCLRLPHLSCPLHTCLYPHHKPGITGATPAKVTEAPFCQIY